MNSRLMTRNIHLYIYMFLTYYNEHLLLYNFFKYIMIFFKLRGCEQIKDKIFSQLTVSILELGYCF